MPFGMTVTIGLGLTLSDEVVLIVSDLGSVSEWTEGVNRVGEDGRAGVVADMMVSV